MYQNGIILMWSIRLCIECIQLTGSQDAAPRVLLPHAPPRSSSSEQYFCLNLATIVQNFDYSGITIIFIMVFQTIWPIFISLGGACWQSVSKMAH